MADIDKALPNEPRKTVNVPGEEEIQEQIVEEIQTSQEEPGPVETIENEDGSVDINFDPNAASPEGGDEHYANLAEFLPDEGNPSPSADFYVTELEPRGVRTGPDDYDIEFDGENYGNSVDELMSDTGRLEYFATGKTDMKKIEKSNEKRKKVKAMNESTMEQAEYLETKYGPGDEGDYFQDFSDYD